MERKRPGNFFRKFGCTSRGCPLFGNFWKYCSTRYWKLPKNSKRNFWLNGKRPFFPGRNVPNGISCSISKKPPLIPFSGLRGRFSVDGTDFYNLYSSWMKLNSPEFYLPFAKTKHFYKTFTLPFMCSKFTLDMSYMKPPYCIFFSHENKLLLLRVGEVKIKLIDYCTYFEFRLRLCHVRAMHASFGFVVLLMVTDRLFPFLRWMSWCEDDWDKLFLEHYFLLVDYAHLSLTRDQKIDLISQSGRIIMDNISSESQHS